MKKLLTSAAVAVIMAAAPAYAHFQLVYTPEVNIEKPAELPFKLIFWHPHENGHAMDMGQPEQFFYVHKGKKTDLMDQLKPITFHGAHNESKAFETSVKVRRNGDYIFTLVPAPYYEKGEDIYIQQITKSYINKGGMPTGWNEAQGLATEIVPLNKPTNVIAGSSFSGILLSEGKPVPGAEIEIVADNQRMRPEASEVERLCAANDKAQRLAGWTPDYGGPDGLRRGLEHTVAWFSDPQNLAAYKHDRYNI